MLTKSEVIATLNEAVKLALVNVVHNVMVGAYDEPKTITAVQHYINGVRICRDFYPLALKAIEEEFKES